MFLIVILIYINFIDFFIFLTFYISIVYELYLLTKVNNPKKPSFQKAFLL